VDKDTVLAKAIEQLRVTVGSLADEMTQIGPGWVARSATLPKVFGLNQVRISEPVDFAEAVSFVEEHMADLPYRHIIVEHPATGRVLEEPFRLAGWSVEREVFMSLDRDPDRRVDTEAVELLDEAQMQELMRMWALEEHSGISEERLSQLDEYNKRVGRLWDEKCYGVVEGGSPLTITKLRAASGVAWIEDVYTVPEARGRGQGRAVVNRVTEVAKAGNPDLVFIVADDNDWPKELYGKIGFDPVGLVRVFRKTSNPNM
jgi:GNAT superfamily N-acetyltransferase